MALDVGISDMLSISQTVGIIGTERTKSGVCAQSGEFGIFNPVTHSRYIVFGIGMAAGTGYQLGRVLKWMRNCFRRGTIGEIWKETDRTRRMI